MKKLLFFIIAFSFFTTNSYAQKDELIKDGIEVVGNVVKLFKNKKLSKNSPTATDSYGTVANSSNETIQEGFADPEATSIPSEQQMRITTNSPYFKVSIVKCVANGKTVMLEMKMTNTSGEDANGVAMYNGITVYDDQGNEYGDGNVGLKFANKEFSNHFASHDFIADVPVKVTIKIEGVSTLAETLARVTIPLSHGNLGLKADTPITLRNIPITRE